MNWGFQKQVFIFFTSRSWEDRDQEASLLGLVGRGVLLPVAFLLCSHLLDRVKGFGLIGVLLFFWLRFCSAGNGTQSLIHAIKINALPK